MATLPPLDFNGLDSDTDNSRMDMSEVSHMKDSVKERRIPQNYRNDEVIEENCVILFRVKIEIEEVIWPHAKFSDLDIYNNIDIFDACVFFRKY